MVLKRLAAIVGQGVEANGGHAGKMKSEVSRKRFIVLPTALALITAATLILFYKTGKGKHVDRIILISIDTCRADYLSCYGHAQNTTPNLDALADEAIVFTNCVSPVPLTLPAHSSIFTGTVPPYHGARDNIHYKLGEDNLTLAEVLRDNGYRTGAVIGSFVLDARFGLNQGFDYYQDEFEESHSFLEISERRGEEVTCRANDWLERNQKERFFLFLHYFDPHADYRPPEPFNQRFKDNPYAGEIAYTDYCMGKLIDKLKELQLYDSALVIVVGDHGEGLGEHGEDEHSFFVYQSTLKVPLIVKPPAGIHHKKVDNLVGLIDVMPTILGYTGISPPKDVQGDDVNELFHNGKSFTEDKYYYCESLCPTQYGCNGLKGIVSAGYKYIQTSREELYELKRDPHELNNRAAVEGELLRAMRLQLKTILSAQSRSGQPVSAVEHGGEAIERLSSLGYVAGKIDETEEFDPRKPDAKDFIDYHRLSRKYSIAMAERRYDRARRVCAEMHRRYPEVVNILSMLGYACFEQGNYKEAVNYFKDYLQSSPEDSEAYYLLGVSLVRENKPDEAVVQFKKTLSLNPKHVSAHANLAATLILCDKHSESLEHFEQAFKLGSTDPHLYINYGLALVKLGNIDKAVAQWNKALTLNPQLPEAYQNIGKAMSQQGRMEEAVKHWFKSLELNPSQPNLLNDIAWVMTTYSNHNLRDPNKAIELSSRACELTQYQNAVFLNTLATAYAANGQLEQAMTTTRQAIELAISSNQLSLAQELRISLESYRSQFDTR